MLSPFTDLTAFLKAVSKTHSASGDEKSLADAVDAALGAAPYLQVVRSASLLSGGCRAGLARAVLVLTLTASCAGFAGCARASQPTNPYAAQYAAAEQATTSEYVKTILQSGKITVSDVKDSEQQVIKCTSDLGLNATFDPDPWGLDQYGLVYTGNLSTDQIAAAKSCYDKWMGPILQLYNSQFANPDNLDWNTLVATCLVRKGLAPAGFTGQDYASLLAQQQQPFSVGPSSDGDGSNTGTFGDQPIDVRIPGGSSLLDPVALACQALPLK